MERLDEGYLLDLIVKHDDPLAFAAEALKAIQSGKLSLKTRGASNTRELIALYYKHKSKKAKPMAESIHLDSFKSHLREAKKNTHMTHAEDSMYLNGYSGFQSSMCLLDNVLSKLSGSSTSKTNITTKFDGSPAVWLGINPENGKFFVATKSLFNKTPKLNYEPSDIPKNHKGGVVDVLPTVLKYGKSLGIKSGIYQGDLMYTPSILTTKNIDGEPHYYFQPNTIAYAVPVNSDMGKRIGKSKIGIVFHTEYTGPNLKELSANFNIDLSGKFKNTSQVFWTDAYFKDVSGVATFTKSESTAARKELNDIRKRGRQLRGIMTKVSSNKQGVAAISQYNNAEVRAGSVSLNVSGFIAFVGERMRISNVGRERVIAFAHEYKAELEQLFELHRDIAQFKLKIIRKLESVKSMKHFLTKGDDLVVTKPEGFVCIDKVGNALKLVDRINFSRANFCKNT